jgi:hypothetical protein
MSAQWQSEFTLNCGLRLGGCGLPDMKKNIGVKMPVLPFQFDIKSSRACVRVGTPNDARMPRTLARADGIGGVHAAIHVCVTQAAKIALDE